MDIMVGRIPDAVSFVICKQNRCTNILKAFERGRKSVQFNPCTGIYIPCPDYTGKKIVVVFGEQKPAV